MRPFTDTLREQRNGRLVDELTDKFRKLVEAVSATGKVGTLNLQLKLKPRANTDGEQIEVEDIVKLTVPEPSKSTTLFFAHEGKLLREDPHQRNFEGLEIVNPDKESKESKAS